MRSAHVQICLRNSQTAHTTDRTEVRDSQCRRYYSVERPKGLHHKTFTRLWGEYYIRRGEEYEAFEACLTHKVGRLNRLALAKTRSEGQKERGRSSCACALYF